MRRAAPLVISMLAACRPAAPPTERVVRYGEVMTEVGRRFEAMGRAARVQRWELAEYQLGELEETVAGLESAQPPRESAGVDLKPSARAFVAAQPAALAAALKTRSIETFARAFRDAAAVCNGCHALSGHRFIEIPANPGWSVPRMTAPGASEGSPPLPSPPATPRDAD